MVNSERHGSFKHNGKLFGFFGEFSAHGHIHRAFALSLYLATSFIAAVGHLVTQSPQPMHNLWSIINESPTISLAPNWHRSTQMPQPVHLDMSVADVVSDVSNCGKSPKRRTEDSIAQQHEQQLQMALIWFSPITSYAM